MNKSAMVSKILMRKKWTKQARLMIHPRPKPRRNERRRRRTKVGGISCFFPVHSSNSIWFFSLAATAETVDGQPEANGVPNGTEAIATLTIQPQDGRENSFVVSISKHICLDDEKEEEGDEQKSTTAKKKNKKKKKGNSVDREKFSYIKLIILPATTNGVHPTVSAPLQQTDPPSIPISELYPDGNYPEGQILEHPTPKNPSNDG